MEETIMLVCIGSDVQNKPIVEYINFDADDNIQTLQRTAELMAADYEEVYLISVDIYHAAFIDAIRKSGVRIPRKE